MTIFFHWPLRVLLFLCFINFTTNCQAFDWKELASELKKGKWYDSRNDCNSIEVRLTESPEIVPDRIEGSAEWIVIGPLSDDDVFDRYRNYYNTYFCMAGRKKVPLIVFHIQHVPRFSAIYS